MADKVKSAMNAPRSAMNAPASLLAEVKGKTKAPPKPDMLVKGQVVSAQSGNNYVVGHQLGKGGFGEVYKVYTTAEPDKMFAMKVEPNKCKPGNENMLRLKVELRVFDTIAAATTVDKTHFVKMHDKGKTADFKFYVMDIIWLSLKEVVEDVCKRVLSEGTRMKIARQTLEGIEALHELGFLHRDIKAANYAVGLPPKDNIIYLLDFGIARPYKDEKTGAVKMPRARVPFMGTLKYASRRSMESLEQCRKDDLEVWLYMMLDLYDRNNLSWKKEPDSKKILQLKYDLFLHKPGPLKIWEGYLIIMRIIDKMAYEDKGDFPLFYKKLDEIRKQENIKMDLPLEWVGKKEKSPVKQKSEMKKVEPEKKETPSAIKSLVKSIHTKPDFDANITVDPPNYVTFKAVPEKQIKEVTISNANDQAVTFEMKTHARFTIQPSFLTIPPNSKTTAKVTYNGSPEAIKPHPKERFSMYMLLIPKGAPCDWAVKAWKDPKTKFELALSVRLMELKIHFEGHPTDTPENKEEEDGSEGRGGTMKTARKKESKKKRKESRKKRDKRDRDEVMITMEALKDELRRKKRRSREKTRDEYWRDEDEDEEDSEDDYSDEDEEDYRRRRKRGHKKRSRERSARSRDYSDRSDRDERDERDERDDRRSQPRRSAESRKRAKEKRDEKRDDDVSMKKDAKIPEKPSAEKSEPEKKADEAAPAKK